MVRIGDAEEVNLGERVYVISSSKDLKNKITKGTLSSIKIDSQRKILEIKAPLSEDSIGGPLFNQKGEVIGIVTLKESQNLVFAIPVNLIKDQSSGQRVFDLKETKTEDFRQDIDSESDDAEAHYNLGVAYLLLNDRDSALEQYKILKNLDPEMADELFNLIYE
ncbi:MAG: trypsin-like peptidase domain-containing protein [Candidatus Caldatribacteriaceae bacterium]